jgi:hypothetical protein
MHFDFNCVISQEFTHCHSDTIIVIIITLTFTVNVTDQAECHLSRKGASAKARVYSLSAQILAFANAPFLLEFLVLSTNGYLAGWFHVKLYEMHTAQLLHTLSSLTAEQTNSSVVGVAI